MNTRIPAQPDRTAKADFDALCSRVSAILKRHPGIEQDRLLTILGYTKNKHANGKGGGRAMHSYAALRTVKDLAAAGVLEVCPVSDIRENVTIYPAGYQRQTQPRDRTVDLSVKTRIDPDYIGAWKTPKGLRRRAV